MNKQPEKSVDEIVTDFYEIAKCLTQTLQTERQERHNFHQKGFSAGHKIGYKEGLKAERQKREEMVERAKEADARDLAKWLHENHERLGPYIWEACCRVYGHGGTPEAALAYKKIVLSVKDALTQPTTLTNDKE